MTKESDDSRIEALADEFLDRKRCGERATISEYCAKHPDLAHEIRELFPALIMMEDLKPDSEPYARSAKGLPPTLERVGGYRIVGEIGRGGMGVVYEAEQESLGRRVALKVLPHNLATDQRLLTRFQREARAAARMHHTNIVPVFEVGQEGDHVFYTMQLIQGRGLDHVIADLARLHGRLPVDKQTIVSRKATADEKGGSSQQADSSNGRDGESIAIAKSLLSGRFQIDDLADSSSSPIGDTKAPPPSSASKSSSVLPGTSGSSSSSSGRRRFYRSVAQLGWQAAGALAYAHQRGIIHRDIKPSNLLLDTAGVLWVTDFGLAKTEDVGLTQTGDVLGTIRYMSPERFSGECDARADIYSLGLTLYEFLALRPAFESSDRLKLIDLISKSNPLKPRYADPNVPLDLETIVLKSIEKDPRGRYVSAEEMAEDLRRFIRDEPIKARRISLGERWLRWSRRNKPLAVLLTTTAALLASIAVILLIALARETKLRQISEKMRYAAEMNQVSRETGIRIADVDELISDWHPGGNRVDLRGWEWYYLQSLGELQGELAREPWQHDVVWSVHWNPEGTRLASTSFDGSICVWKMDSDEPVRVLRHSHAVWTARWSPDGSKLATGGEGGELKIWDVGQDYGETRLQGHAAGKKISVVSWSPDGTQLASACDDMTIRIWQTSQNFKSDVLQDTDRVWDVAWSPDGKQLASTSNTGVVKLWDPKELTLSRRFKAHDGGASSAQWHPDSKRLATSGGDATLRLWNTETADGADVEALHVFEHEDEVLRIKWSRDGARLASTGRDSIVYAWDLNTKRIAGYFKGHLGASLCVDWHPDGTRLATGGTNGVRVWKWKEPPHPPRLTIDPDDRYAAAHVHSIAWDPNGEKLATIVSSAYDELACWDISTQTKDFSMPIRGDMVAWSPDGTKLGAALANGDIAIFDRAGEKLKQVDAKLGEFRSLAWNPQGTQLAAGSLSSKRLQIWNTASWKRIREISAGLDGHNWGRREVGLQSIDWSPDGTRLLSAVGGMIQIWDAATWKEVRTVDRNLSQATCVKWSPDGTRFVAAGTDGEATIWDAATGDVIRTLPGHRNSLKSVQWSPDGTRLMTGSKGGKLNLWDIETGRPAFTLLEGHHLSCDWSPDGRKLVAGTNDSRIEIWDATAGYEQAMVSGDNNRITATKPYALDQRDRNALSSNDR